MRIDLLMVLALMPYISAATAGECGVGTKEVNSVAIPKREIVLRVAPHDSARRIINQKATEAFRKTHYANIDESSKVMEVCRKGAWSYVELIEPHWLRGTHNGWVPTSTLNPMLMSKSGKRIFRESEVGWGPHTSPHKKTILNAMNGYLQDECRDLDPQSLDSSPTRGSSANPVFFITCGHPPSARNIYFSTSGIVR